MEDVEKKKLVSYIKHYSNFYFVKVIGYCIMSNHFHFLIKFKQNHKFTYEEVADSIKSVLIEKGKSLDSALAYIELNPIRAKSLIIGSKTFLKQTYSIFGGTVIKKKNHHVYKTEVSDKILSVRKSIE